MSDLILWMVAASLGLTLLGICIFADDWRQRREDRRIDRLLERLGEQATGDDTRPSTVWNEGGRFHSPTINDGRQPDHGA